MAEQQSDAIKKRFDMIRNKIGTEAKAQRQQADEGLKRQFSRTGMIGSGAFVKTGQKLGTELGKQEQAARESVDMQELGERQRIAEGEQARAFAREERLGSQGFAASQAAIQRKYGSAEALKQRAFQTAERLGSQGFSKEMAQSQMDFQQGLADIQQWQWAKQFDQDKLVSQFNMDMAEKQFNKKSLMERIINPFGFDDSKLAGNYLTMGALDPIKTGSDITGAFNF